MAKADEQFFENVVKDEIEQEQHQATNKKFDPKLRKQIEERLEKKPLGAEDSDDDYLDHYYDFDD